MPTYEYACSSCNNEWETEQSIKDAALTECPSCHAQTARRQISRGTGFILKGSGWYSDLYSSSSNKKPESSGTSEGASGGDKAAAGSGDSGGGTSGGSGSGSPAPAAPAPSSTPST